MLLWAVAVGFLGALATILFRECILGLQILLTGKSGSFVAIAKSFTVAFAGDIADRRWNRGGADSVAGKTRSFSRHL